MDSLMPKYLLYGYMEPLGYLMWRLDERDGSELHVEP